MIADEHGLPQDAVVEVGIPTDNADSEQADDKGAKGHGGTAVEFWEVASRILYPVGDGRETKGTKRTKGTQPGNPPQTSLLSPVS